MVRFAGEGDLGIKDADEGSVVWADVFDEGGSVVGRVECES